MQRKVGSVVLPFPTQENAAIPRRLTEFGAEGIAGDATACLLRCNADQLVTLDNTGGRPIYLLETSAQGMRLTLVKAGEARPISDMTSIYFSDPRAISAGEGNVPHPAIRCMRLFRAAQTQGLSDREEA
ncbi:hypothetical protein [Armatimonas rosea]|uniref:Uncharacterized protein n=1 Tax=Armatimonas rosea TaxID=685828 RepID=A0A7W9SW32_ARMRO|nr:hypothetical protein [Armatimonas rosea]MBB6053891.1 hypothetical protein [Armatimonas rosea]